MNGGTGKKKWRKGNRRIGEWWDGVEYQETWSYNPGQKSWNTKQVLPSPHF